MEEDKWTRELTIVKSQPINVRRHIQPLIDGMDIDTRTQSTRRPAIYIVAQLPVVPGIGISVHDIPDWDNPLGVPGVDMLDSGGELIPYGIVLGWRNWCLGS